MNPERPEATYLAKRIIERYDLNIFPNHMAQVILDGFKDFREKTASIKSTNNLEVKNENRKNI